MEIWLDTINMDLIRDANSLRMIYGVTTNPTILAKAVDVIGTVTQLLEIQPGRLAVQVIGKTHNEMVEEGMRLFELSNRIVVKVPINRDGLIAIKSLSRNGVSVLGTTVFHPNQAMLAALAGAEYVAPYLNRMQDLEIDPFAALEVMSDIYHEQGLYTKILAASLGDIEQVMTCARMGIEAVTLKDDVYEQLFTTHPATEEHIQQFRSDWITAHPEKLFMMSETKKMVEI